MHISKLIILLLILPLAHATVGVYVSYPDGEVFAQCLDVDVGIDGYELLESTRLDIIWAGPSSFGHNLCMIEGVGDSINGDLCSYDGKYWGFFTRDNDEWSYMPVGFDAGDECWNGDLDSFDGHFCTSENDLVGFRYGIFGEEPSETSWEDICEPLKWTEIDALVGEQTQTIEIDGGSIVAKQGERFQIYVDFQNNHPSAKIQDVELKLTIFDVDGEDLEKYADLDEVDPNDKGDIKLSYTVPSNAPVGIYKADLVLSGQSEDGIEQEESLRINIKFQEKAVAEPVKVTQIEMPEPVIENPKHVSTIKETPDEILDDVDSEYVESEQMEKLNSEENSSEKTFVDRHGKVLALGLLELILIALIVGVVLILRK